MYSIKTLDTIRRMNMGDEERIVYCLTVEDLQTVADEYLERELTPEEIKAVEDRVGDYIPWYDAIEEAIRDVVGVKENNK
jgi:hypothetical protein